MGLRHVFKIVQSPRFLQVDTTEKQPLSIFSDDILSPPPHPGGALGLIQCWFHANYLSVTIVKQAFLLLFRGWLICMTHCIGRTAKSPKLCIAESDCWVPISGLHFLDRWALPSTYVLPSAALTVPKRMQRVANRDVDGMGEKYWPTACGGAPAEPRKY